MYSTYTFHCIVHSYFRNLVENKEAFMISETIPIELKNSQNSNFGDSDVFWNIFGIFNIL